MQGDSSVCDCRHKAICTKYLYSEFIYSNVMKELGKYSPNSKNEVSQSIWRLCLTNKASISTRIDSISIACHHTNRCLPDEYIVLCSSLANLLNKWYVFSASCLRTWLRHVLRHRIQRISYNTVSRIILCRMRTNYFTIWSKDLSNKRMLGKSQPVCEEFALQ